MELDWVNKMRELEATESDYVEAWWKLKHYGEEEEKKVERRFENE